MAHLKQNENDLGCVNKKLANEFLQGDSVRLLVFNVEHIFVFRLLCRYKLIYIWVGNVSTN